jgi:hypothetical protein
MGKCPRPVAQGAGLNLFPSPGGSAGHRLQGQVAPLIV